MSLNVCAHCEKGIKWVPIRGWIHIHDNTPACSVHPDIKIPTLSAPEHLESGADTYRVRNKEYGNSYRQFGRVMDDLFPHGVTTDSIEDWNRLGLISQIVSKLCRYSTDFDKPHRDSIHDLMVYCAMLMEVEDEQSQTVQD